MTHESLVQRRSIHADFKAGNWGPKLVAQARAVALKTRKTCDWITWMEACHATQGITHDDILLMQGACSAQQLQCSALKWRLENLMYALKSPVSAQLETLTDERLIKQLCLDQASSSLIRKKMGLTPTGAQLGDYSILLARIASLANNTLNNTNGKSAVTALRLINKAASIQKNMQGFVESVSQLLADKTPTDGVYKVAVVGNAPSIMNSEHGAEIDNCDIVVRFNRANTGHTTAFHAGSRTDIWVMSPSTPVQCCPKDTHTVVISGVQPFLRPSRYWTTLSDTPILGECPAGIWYLLVRQLQAPPSAGILVLSTLQSLNLNLDIKRYGFTENQGVHGLQKNHHADSAVVSSRHNWPREVQWIQENY